MAPLGTIRPKLPKLPLRLGQHEYTYSKPSRPPNTMQPSVTTEYPLPPRPQRRCQVYIFFLVSQVSCLYFVVCFLDWPKNVGIFFLCASTRVPQAPGPSFGRADGLGDIIYYNWTSSTHSLQRTITRILHISVKCTIRCLGCAEYRIQNENVIMTIHHLGMGLVPVR